MGNNRNSRDTIPKVCFFKFIEQIGNIAKVHGVAPSTRGIVAKSADSVGPYCCHGRLLLGSEYISEADAVGAIFTQVVQTAADSDVQAFLSCDN